MKTAHASYKVPTTLRHTGISPIPDMKNSLVKWLENLGRLPRNFDGEKLVQLLTHEKEKIRILAVYNLGKLGDIVFLPILLKTAMQDKSTAVRREATSSIGRMRNEKTISALAKLAADNDPKVVLQALRGLLVFPKNKTINEVLERLASHPNEMILDVIEKERTYDFETSIGREQQIESPDYLKNLVVQGDVLSILKSIPAESIHMTFTSPPYYNARDYSIYSSYAEYLLFLQKVFKQSYRITKPGRFLILNTSPIIVPRVSRQHSSRRYPIPFDIHPLLVKMGWEFIDDIVWVKPEASVKNRNGGFAQHRKPLAYKPNARTEYLMVYRKKTHRLIDWNIRQYDYTKVKKSLVNSPYETSNVWQIDPVFDKTHSAVFPLALCERVINYYSMVGDLIFDPFGGSGTLGMSAASLDRFFFMTEIVEEYIDRMKERFNKFPMMFSPVARFTGKSGLQALKRKA